MSGKIDDITGFLRDESTGLADLDWLVVDPEEYQAVDTLPRQNLDAIPELEEQWKYLSEADKYRLSPENREPRYQNTPFWAEKEIANDLGDPEKIEIVETYFRRALQDGLTARDAVSRLRVTFDKDLLTKAAPRIVEASKEEGLLGVVYVDASLFPGWDRKKTATLQQDMGAAGREALYVVADAYQQVDDFGRCSKFQKEVIFDVNDIDYDEDLWEHYKSLYEAKGKDLHGIPEELDPREKLRRAFVAPYKEDKKATGHKPVEGRRPDVTAKEAAQRFAEFSQTWKREVVENSYRTKKVRRVARAMMAGQHGPEIQDAVRHDPDLASLKPHLYLMGNLYADLSYFEDDDDVREFLARHTFPIVVGMPYNGGGKKATTRRQSFHIKMPESLNHIVHRYALNRYGRGYHQKARNRKALERFAQRLEEMSSGALRKMAQTLFSQPLPEEVRKYEHLAPVFIDPTKSIGTKEALEKFETYQPNREKVENTYREELERELAAKMLQGDQSEAMRSRLDAEGFRRLAKHLYLMGNLYIPADYFTTEEIQEYTKRNERLASLPVLREDQIEEFLRRKTTKAKIFKAYVHTMGVSKKTATTLAKQVLEMNPEEVRKIAQYVYSRPENISGAKYNVTGAPRRRAPVISLKEAVAALEQVPETEETPGITEADKSLIRKVARRMLAGDHGPAVQVMLQTDKTLAPLKPHLHLLGKLYTASYVFGDSKEYAAFKNIHEHLKGLPELGETPQLFFQRGATLDKITERMAKLQGVAPERYETYKEASIQKLRTRSPEQVMEFARRIYAQELPEPGRAEYAGHEQTAHYMEGPQAVKTKIESQVSVMLKSARDLLAKGYDPDNMKEALRRVYGDQVLRAGNVYVDHLIEREKSSMESFVPEATLEAVTGVEQMAEMELLESQANNPLNDIEIREESEHNLPVMDEDAVSFDGLVIE